MTKTALETEASGMDKQEHYADTLTEAAAWKGLPEGSTINSMLMANAIASAAANVPLLLASVGFIVVISAEAGLYMASAIFGGMGLAIAGWRWLIGKRFKRIEPLSEDEQRIAGREVEGNAALAGLMWAYGCFAIYPELDGVWKISYPLLVAGSSGVGAFFASLVGRAYLFLMVPQIVALSTAHLVVDDMRSFWLAALILGYGYVMNKAAMRSRASATKLAQALIERDRLRADHARLAELELREARVAAELEKAEASATRDLFVAKASHEFRTPLQSIVALADLMQLKAETTGDSQMNSLVARLGRAADQLMHQANDLASFVRSEHTGRYEIRADAMNLPEVVETSLQELREIASRKGLSVEVVASQETLYADAMRLQQIITNLASNAIKYTREGKVRVIAEVRKSEGGGHVLHVSVEDTGIGIDQQALPKVFEPWFRGTKEGRGLGLGLSIVRTLVGQLNGMAKVDSEPGKGTTVAITMPVRIAERGIAAECLVADQLRGLKVLMVDDEDVVRTTVGDLLRASGMDCTEASSSAEAMAVLKGESFNVALIDLQMPDVDGYQLARTLRASPAHSSMRLLAMSAYEISEDGAHLFDAFVPKPASLATLEKAIAAAMRRGGADSNGHTAGERPDKFASTNSK